MKEVRGDLRIIYSDSLGIAQEREMPGQVSALVGPIGKHTSHPELQDALGLIAMAFNRRHDRLSRAKHMELLRGRHEEGAKLLREALAALEEAALDVTRPEA
jgi:hypothetical protein